MARVGARRSKAMELGCRPQVRTRTRGGGFAGKAAVAVHVKAAIPRRRQIDLEADLWRNQPADAAMLRHIVGAGYGLGSDNMLLAVDSAERSAQAACGLAGAKAYRVAERSASMKL